MYTIPQNLTRHFRIQIRRFMHNIFNTRSSATTDRPHDVLTVKILSTALQMYTVSPKNKTPNSCPQLHKILTDFQTFFTDRLSRKFATNLCLNIPTCLKDVATLPCEIWMSEKWRQSEICIVINDKSESSITKHLRNDELLHYTFFTQSNG